MPRFYDSKGKSHVLAEEIGRGGEGTVYFCEGNTELVAKIYHEPISDEKAKKLQLMAENKNKRLLKVAAWVVETLHDKPNGKIIGFLMPSIKAKEIHELYSLKSRRRHFPHATWHYLIHTSTNLARAFYSLHKYSHVIGDVNHGNCVVLADGTVKLIDCDSYAISDGEKRFPCEVGVATHLAPELQKANLSEVERIPEHDNFALAVVIFQLLFLGRHPFAGNYLGEKDKTLEDCISEFRFAYGKNAKKLMVKQPPGTLNLDEVSPRITDLFERAFDEKSDNRPNPREWIEALVDMSEKLAQCGVNPGHRFFNNLVSCPWCRIESQTGLMLFPFVFSEELNDGETAFNIFTVEKLIENLGNQRNLPAKLSKPKVIAIPEPTPEILENANLQRNHQFILVGGYFLGLVFLTMILGIALGTIIGIFAMIVLFANFSNGNKETQVSLMNKLSEAENKWESLEKEFALLVSPKVHQNNVGTIRKKVKDYKDLQLNTRKDLKRLESEHKHRDFVNYLRKFRVANNEIEGISNTVRNDLVKKRVWTAAEIDEERLDKDFGVNLFTRQKLLKWRKDLEQNYSFKEDTKVLGKKKEEFLETHKFKRRNIEGDIQQSIESLQKGSVEAQKTQKLLIPKSEEITKEISQHKSDLSVVGDTSFALASLILITILVPFFGGIISEVSSRRPVIADDSYSSSGDGYSSSSSGSGGGFSDGVAEGSSDVGNYDFSKENLSIEDAEVLAVVDENITDEEISNLDYASRKLFSNNLVRQAINLVQNAEEISKDKNIDSFEVANDKVKLAMRTEPDNLKAFEEFGKTLYDNEQFKKSLEFFVELDLEKNSDVIDLYTGMSFLKLKNYKDAKEKLLKVVTDNASTQSYYQLGLAYKELKDYRKAEKSFEYAIQMDSSNVEAQYELGYTYYKLRSKEEFNRQYAVLLERYPEKAKELLENSYKLPPSKKELEKIKEGDDTPVMKLDTPTKLGKKDTSGSGYGSGKGSGTGSGDGSAY